MSDPVISVAIVEDDREIRDLLTLIIDSSPGFTCKQSFNDCESAIEPILAETPQVVLMDIDLPGMSGINGVAALKEKLLATDFIMLTIKEDDDSIFDSLCAGATGYLLKDTGPADLLLAIREVVDGGSPMSAGIARRVTNSFKRSTDSPLTTRETEVLNMLCDGKNYKEIATDMFISGDTVRVHIKNIYRKLQVNSRGQAVKKAIKDRLV
ncbi:MAG: response regulator transcription factor [Calditrichia bacterium]